MSILFQLLNILREIFKSTARARPILGRLPHIAHEQMNLFSKVVSPLEVPLLAPCKPFLVSHYDILCLV